MKLMHIRVTRTAHGDSNKMRANRHAAHSAWAQCMRHARSTACTRCAAFVTSLSHPKTRVAACPEHPYATHMHMRDWKVYSGGMHAAHRTAALLCIAASKRRSTHVENAAETKLWRVLRDTCGHAGKIYLFSNERHAQG